MNTTNSHDPMQTRLPEPTPEQTGSWISPRSETDAGSDTSNSAAPDPMPGNASAIPGYEVIGILGRGGMGIVYKAHQVSLKRIVALKMILAGGHAGLRELTRFRIEAEAVARLQHPNIVQIYEVGEVGGHPYFALEFVEGGTLSARIGDQPLPAADTIRIVAALARAMQLAHSRNVVHRDLKPANILLAKDGNPKITDFGLARQLDSDSNETQVGTIMGTPSYMAPEQAAGNTHEAGPASDVYSLGAILYACLTGRAPFKGTSIVETLDQVRTREPELPSRFQSNVPFDLETICLKCLRKKPEQRYASAAELADDLERFQRGEPILARPVGSIERAVKWVRRRPTAAALIGAVGLLLIGATTFSLLFADRERKSSLALENKNGELRVKQEETDLALKASRVSAARLALNRGLILCDQGDVSRGLVALSRALATADEAEDADLESAIRLNLAAWERQTWRLRALLPAPHASPITAVTLHPEGKMLAVALKNQTVQLWDASEGREGHVLKALPLGGDTWKTHVSVHFSIDGRYILTRTDNVIHYWNVASGQPVFPPLRHTNRVTSVALDPAGKFILTGDEKGVTRLWDTATGLQQGVPLVHKTAIDTIAFRSDGLQALTGTRDGTVQIIGMPTGMAMGEKITLQGGGVTTARFSNNGKRILVGTRAAFATGKVHVLETATGKAVYPPLTCNGPVEEAVFGQDDTTVIIRTGLGSAIANARIWHPGNGIPVAPLDHSGDVRCVVMSPDGNTLLTAGNGGVARFWDTSRGLVAGPPLYHQGNVLSSKFSHDGKTLLTFDGEVRIWQAPQHLQRAILKHADEVHTVAFSRDGKLCLTGSKDHSARLWHVATGVAASEPLRHDGGVMAGDFSPDSKLALTGGTDTHLRLWDTANGQLRATLTGHQQSVVVVTFSPDGSLALSGSFDGTARLWDVAAGQPVGDPLKHRGPVQAVAFSPDGQTIMTGSNDKTARLWSVTTRQPLCEPLVHRNSVESVAFSRDGSIAFSGSRYGKDIRSWDSANGQEQTALAGHQDGVWTVASNRWNDFLLSGGADHTARFWNVKTSQQTGMPIQHQDIVRDVAFSPDSRSALTGSYDTTARRWHSPTGIPIGPPFQHRGKIRSVALCPDGRSAGTASWDGTAALWEAPPSLSGTHSQLSLRTNVWTGIDLDDGGAVRPLDSGLWQQRFKLLDLLPQQIPHSTQSE